MSNDNLKFSLRSIVEKNKLNGTNFLDWERNLRIILRSEGREDVLATPVPTVTNTSSDEEKATATRVKSEALPVTCLMLAAMEPDLQKRFEHSDAYSIITELKTLFQDQARIERYETHKAILDSHLVKGKPVSPHVIKLTGLFKRMENLGTPYDQELATDIVLRSLHDGFAPFRMQYHMNGLKHDLNELHSMLKNAEGNIIGDKKKEVLNVNNGKGFKRVAKSKSNYQGKSKQVAKPKNGEKPKVAADHDCFYCKAKGHWKRNCPKYLEDKRNGTVSSTSGIYVIEIMTTNVLTLDNGPTWVLDTACGAHITSYVQGLRNRRQVRKGEINLCVGNGASVAALSVGDLSLSLPSGLVLELNNCYYVPCITKNLISYAVLDHENFEFSSKNGCISIFKNDIFYATARVSNGLFVLDLKSELYNINNKRQKLKSLSEAYLWHCRLGHISVNRMKKLHKDGLLKDMDYESIDTCESCLMGKMTRSPFKGTFERATELLGVIHTDVCGPMSTEARGGYRYFITFTDDMSRYGYVYLMSHKSESFEKFKEFQNEVETQSGKKIKALRSDRGGEYLSHEFDHHLKNCGIVTQLSTPGTPQLNGVSERRNRTLLDMVRSMMSFADLPLSFWGYALTTAVLTLNRTPSRTVDKTPYEIWTGKIPKLSFLKIWGCEAYVKRLQTEKLAPKSDKCYFIGYPKGSFGYYFYNPTQQKVFVARDSVFLEREFFSNKSSGRNIHLEIVQDDEEQQTQQQEDMDDVDDEMITFEGLGPQIIQEPEQEDLQTVMNHVPDPVVEQVEPTRRSERPRVQPRRYDDFILNESLDVLMLELSEPSTYKQAVTGPDSKKWLEAMRSEMDSMFENQVWDLIDLPDGVKPIGSKWIFKLKTDTDGNISVYKARLVAKGFRQIHGIDYDETFSPVVMIRSIRIILAIAAYYDYEIWQMDVKTAFLNGFLEEDVYMTQPEGFEDPNEAGKVCKLKKSIYGLKQASRSWNFRFDEKIKEFDFIRCEEDPCVYKKFSGSKVAFLVLYVDDILLIGNDIPMLESVKEWLKKCFSMKDLGKAEYILGIKIYRDRSKRLLGLSQGTYIDKILNRFKMQDSKKGFLPIQHGIYLSKKQCPKTPVELEKMKQVPYASAIGSIMYAMVCTRPDVAYALSMCSRYQSNPGEAHWSAAKNILKYLRRTKDDFLVYGGDEKLIVQGYTDASFQTDRDGFESQSGYVFILNGGAVSWKSSKQDTIADSTTEAEYIAASEAAKEAVWIRKFLDELGVVPSISVPIDIYCDNNGAIAQAKEPSSSSKSRHVMRKYHLIRRIITMGDIRMCKVHTDDNIADPLTKPMPRPKHESHTRAKGLKHIGEWL